MGEREEDEEIEQSRRSPLPNRHLGQTRVNTSGRIGNRGSLRKRDNSEKVGVVFAPIAFE